MFDRVNTMFHLPSGVTLVESYPYKAVERDYDYVRLASITAGMSTNFHWFTCLFTSESHL